MSLWQSLAIGLAAAIGIFVGMTIEREDTGCEEAARSFVVVTGVKGITSPEGNAAAIAFATECGLPVIQVQPTPSTMPTITPLP